MARSMDLAHHISRITNAPPMSHKMPMARRNQISMNSSVIARGLRFFVLAALLWKFGPPIRTFIEDRLGLMFTLFVVILLGGFALVRYL